MAVTVDKMDRRGHFNTKRREHLPEITKVTRHQLQKDYRKDGALHL